MKAPQVVTIDFETDAILPRPDYPPVPVGMSIQRPGEIPRYWAWRHPIQNNCTLKDAKKHLQDIFKSGALLLFHAAKFDVDVAVTHMGCKMPKWDRIHDTLYLLFLSDPYASTFALKPSAERYLKMPPTEQDAVRQWLVNHKICKPKDRRWGAHIAKAPGNLVGRYAKGDTIRTLKLFKHLYPEIVRRGMLDAYNRERELMPIFLDNERQGIRVDYKVLAADVDTYRLARTRAEKWLRRKLVAKALDFNSTAEVAEALYASGTVTEWELTKTGKRSTAKKHLTKERFNDPKIWLVLGYRNKLNKCLNTYMEPWLRVAERSGGVIYVGWNQVRQSSGFGSAAEVFGARTGRPSTSPNLLAVTKSFYDRGDGFEHPKFIRGLPELPTIRRYILPDPRQVLIHRDYNQQELRILAHFEDDALAEAYISDPTLDVHSYVQGRIKELTGVEYPRRHVKTLNFGMLYGMGIKRLADTLKIDPIEAKQMKRLQRQVLSGLPELEFNLKMRAASDEWIRTWGGREYYCEPPKIVINDDGEEQLRTYDYKLLNYLIQGSAADATKQALINYNRIRKHGRFLLTVYDEINVSVPLSHVKTEMALLRQAMESVKFDVPMLSDGKVGKSWATLEKYVDK